MPRSCAAAFCKNNAENVKKRGLNITFHSFPSDDSLPKWIDFCKRDEHWKPTKISTVCSLHFKPDDYQMAKSSLPQTLPVLKRLKPYGKERYELYAVIIISSHYLFISYSIIDTTSRFYSKRAIEYDSPIERV